MENDIYVDDVVLLKKRIATLERRNDDLQDKLSDNIFCLEKKVAALRNKYGVLWHTHETLKYHFKNIKKTVDNYSLKDLRGCLKDEDIVYKYKHSGGKDYVFVDGKWINKEDDKK